MCIVFNMQAEQRRLELSGRVQRILHSLATRIPRILLRRVNDVYPSLNECAVSTKLLDNVQCYFYKENMFQTAVTQNSVTDGEVLFISMSEKR
jgi:hypothetical protein